MRARWRWILLLFWLLGHGAAAQGPPVVVLTIDGAIGPATADYVQRGIERATIDGAQLIILRMDTPGGLDTSMRAIIKDILASPIPIAAYVAPDGARAASAGTYILYACHIAAMAPATNLGAATPIRVGGPPDEPAKKKDGKTGGGTLERKQVNDAAAYIRSLAQMRGRNADWAELAVRQAVSLSANEALKFRVVDIVASDTADLLKQLDRRSITTRTTTRVLSTRNVATHVLAPDWRTKFLSAVSDPGIALLLIMFGIYAILIEFYNPGLVLPGVAGSICILTAFYALHLLPVNYAGLALIMLGIGFMVAEAYFPAYGSLGVGGLIAFVLGAVILIDTDTPGFGIPVGLIVMLSLLSLGFISFIVGMAIKARRRPIVSGHETLIGSTGEVLQDCGNEGWARIHGETWRVRAAVPLKTGQRVRVQKRQDLVLDVAPVSDHEGLARER